MTRRDRRGLVLVVAIAVIWALAWNVFAGNWMTACFANLERSQTQVEWQTPAYHSQNAHMQSASISIQNIKITTRSKAIRLNPRFMTDAKWTPYNPSVLLLPRDVWSRHCPDLVQDIDTRTTACQRDDIVLLSLFTKKPGDKYGTTVWMGITSLFDLRMSFVHEPDLFLRKNGWIVPPTFVQSVLGPKAADPRLFLLGNRHLAFVAYSAINGTSTIKGMRDYHVRLGVVATRDKKKTCNSPLCPPRPDGNGGGEFFINCSFSPAHCQEERHMHLYGVEVHRHGLRHVPQKNLQPIQMRKGSLTAIDERRAHFVDFSPPDQLRPLVYTVDTWSGALIARSTMTFAHESCGALGPPQKWRGSTQIVPFDQDLYITIIHAKESNMYRHQFLVMSIVDHDSTSFQVECLHLSPNEVFELPKTGYVFAVGLAHIVDSRFLVSFGMNNARALIQEIAVSIQKTELATPDNDMFQGLVQRKEMQFFTFFVEAPGTKATPARIQQFVKCFRAIQYHHPGHAIHFFTVEPCSFLSKLRELVPFVKIVVFELAELFRGTPAEAYTAKSKQCGWKELSDLIRLAILWRWGGTWIDTDDITIRPMPSLSNVLPYLEWPGVNVKIYWGSKFTLIDGKWKSIMGRDRGAGFHIQNDPLLNFEPKNDFLARWMEELVVNTNRCQDWGQLVPTDIFRKDPVWASRYLTLAPQYSLLLHPAFGSVTKKGPMFPLYDYRLPDGFPHYDTPVSQADFEKYFMQMAKVQPFVTVKVKDEHYEGGGEKRCIPAWIATLDIDYIHRLVLNSDPYVPLIGELAVWQRLHERD